MASACADSSDGRTVAHGRRKGSLRPGNGSSDEIHPSQVAILDAKEWDRMHDKLASWRNPPITKQAQIQNHKMELHQQSQNVVKNWSNTIEGHRQKRLQAHKIKEEKEEAERQRIDCEEAAFQAEQRKKAIERAKTMMYYQTDRVKTLHSSYMLSEVLREREFQTKHVARKAELLKMQEERFLQQQREEQEKAHMKDLIKEKQKSEAMAEVFQDQQIQAMENREKKRAFREAQLQEQKRIDEAVDMFHQSEKERAKQMAEARLEHRKTLNRDLAERAKRNEERRKLEEYEDHKRKVFNDAKRSIEKLKVQKEEEWQEMLEQQQKNIRDNLQTHMEQASQNEDAHTAALVEKQHAKREAEEQERARKQADMSRAMYKHMLEQMSELDAKKKEQKKEELELMKMKQAQAIKVKNEHLRKEKMKRQEAVNLQDFYISQTKEQAARKKVAAAEEQKYMGKNRSLLKVEEDQFQGYARSVMAEVKDRRGPLQPFQKAIKEGAGGGHGPVLLEADLRPSYQATDEQGVELPSYSHYKSDQRTRTQQRMGFNW